MRRQVAYQLGKKNQATFRAMHPEKGMDPLSQIHAMAYLAAQRMEQILSNDAMISLRVSDTSTYSKQRGTISSPPAVIVRYL